MSCTLLLSRHPLLHQAIRDNGDVGSMRARTWASKYWSRMCNYQGIDGNNDHSVLTDQQILRISGRKHYSHPLKPDEKRLIMDQRAIIPIT